MLNAFIARWTSLDLENFQEKALMPTRLSEGKLAFYQFLIHSFYIRFCNVLLIQILYLSLRMMFRVLRDSRNFLVR